MGDKDIKEFLTFCVAAEMEVLSEENMQGFDHNYSRNYDRKQKKLLWSGKYFEKNLKLGYAVRRVSIIAIVIISLLLVHVVSAKTLGFAPWKYITSFLYDNKMDVKIYKKQSEVVESSGKTKLLNVVRDIPKHIPESFQRTAYEKNNDSLYLEWSGREKEYLQYIRGKIEAGLTINMDSEYDTSEKFELKGYRCCYYTKGNDSWLAWDDNVYSHMLVMSCTGKSRSILIRMAESLYEKN